MCIARCVYIAFFLHLSACRLLAFRCIYILINFLCTEEGKAVLLTVMYNCTLTGCFIMCIFCNRNLTCEAN